MTETNMIKLLDHTPKLLSINWIYLLTNFQLIRRVLNMCPLLQSLSFGIPDSTGEWTFLEEIIEQNPQLNEIFYCSEGSDFILNRSTLKIHTENELGERILKSIATHFPTLTHLIVVKESHEINVTTCLLELAQCCPLLSTVTLGVDIGNEMLTSFCKLLPNLVKLKLLGVDATMLDGHGLRSALSHLTGNR